MTKTSYIAKLKKLNTCSETAEWKKAIKWAKAYPTFQAAWDKCEKIDWMLWVVKKTCKSVQRKVDIFLTVDRCIDGSLKHIHEDKVSPEVIRAAQRWSKKRQDEIAMLDIKIELYIASAIGAADEKELKLLPAIVRKNLTIPEL